MLSPTGFVSTYFLRKLWIVQLIDSKFYSVYPACDVIKT